MDVKSAIQQLRQGQKPTWPANVESLDFAQALDNHSDIPPTLRHDFIVPTKAQLKRKTLLDDAQTAAPASSPDEEAIYFCGNSLGLQPKAVSEHLAAYLKTWGSIGVGGHFTQLADSPLAPYQDMVATCAREMARLVGAAPEEVVAMNTLTVNLHLMMAAFYKPTPTRHKIMCEWRPFPSDWYAIESQIEWHGLDPKTSMLLVHPDDGYTMTTRHICDLIDREAHTLALILLPGIQYYTGQLLDIATITARARAHGIPIGWDLAHAAGNVELALHDWDVDFACWCTYKYMNAGAGAIAGAFVHARHGSNGRASSTSTSTSTSTSPSPSPSSINGLKGWYGHDPASRFQMDNAFVPSPGAHSFQLSNPSMMDLTALLGALRPFSKTDMSALRTRSLLLTGYAEALLLRLAAQYPSAFRIITPGGAGARGAQLSVLVPCARRFEQVGKALDHAAVVCDRRKPGIVRVAPVPLYNTFEDVWRFMRVFERALRDTKDMEVGDGRVGVDGEVGDGRVGIEARL